MHELVTLVRPGDRAGGGSSVATMPRDLLEQVRSRVALLALLICVAFAFDPLFYVGARIVARVGHLHLPPDSLSRSGFLYLSIAASAASAVLWRIARSRRVSATLLHTVGLVYEVVICFVISVSAYWQDYLDKGIVPKLTWSIVVVVLFPLILPAPPTRMLLASIAAGAMPLLALAVLDLTGRVPTGVEGYVEAFVASAFAVGFAYMGARVVYGLNRAVAAARELGSYRLEERLGAGGMGEVWRARHRMLARPAAIKLIKPADGGGHAGVSEALLARFEREAQAIARLRSPHTVELFDFGVADNGSFYYVMELLDGLDTDSLVRRFGPIPPERAVFLLRQVCHSLSEAESCGLVHRDIKPANIFLCRYGEDLDFVKVLDFGLVTALDDHERPTGLTAENVVQGTPAFMAPEQALGERRVDGRADLYAVGCVAYWLLTGQNVFAADTPMGLVLQHVQAQPVPPSTRSGRSMPLALEQLVMRCLAKDPAARPQSARELSHALGLAVDERDWTMFRAREWWSANLPVRSSASEGPPEARSGGPS